MDLARSSFGHPQLTIPAEVTCIISFLPLPLCPEYLGSQNSLREVTPLILRPDGGGTPEVARTIVARDLGRYKKDTDQADVCHGCRVNPARGRHENHLASQMYGLPAAAVIGAVAEWVR